MGATNAVTIAGLAIVASLIAVFLQLRANRAAMLRAAAVEAEREAARARRDEALLAQAEALAALRERVELRDDRLLEYARVLGRQMERRDEHLASIAGDVKGLVAKVAEFETEKGVMFDMLMDPSVIPSAYTEDEEAAAEDEGPSPREIAPVIPLRRGEPKKAERTSPPPDSPR